MWSVAATISLIVVKRASAFDYTAANSLPMVPRKDEGCPKEAPHRVAVEHPPVTHIARKHQVRGVACPLMRANFYGRANWAASGWPLGYGVADTVVAFQRGESFDCFLPDAI